MKKTKDIAAFLGVEPGTVRKYCGALEKHGYIVFKDGSGQRQYSDKDATAFQELKALCERSGMTVDSAAEVVATRNLRSFDAIAPSVLESEKHDLMRYDKRYDQMMEAVKEMAERNERQAAELERIHKRMDDQNANITVILREILETRRMLAAANDKKWWKFWRKSNDSS
ncbi:DUF3967 domain-containing protein [Paenibacillus sp. FSL F4-0125]|uniref:DUF3967 domain-containing protein n=1 Tax=Paenibacillus sp. FSL F4-0125 TaxID=2954730 RepID=UPI0030F55535